MATPIPQNRASFTAAEIAFATGGVLVRGAPATRVVGVCTDSRAIAQGNLFAAIVGENVDGHRFLDGAIENGAGALLVEKRSLQASAKGGCVIAVDDTTVALGRLARMHRDRWEREHAGPAVVIAITGSAGKTTTKELCAAALIGSLGEHAVLRTRGNLNNLVGAPMTLLGLEHEHTVAVIEVGTSKPGEIAALAAIVRPDIAMLTNVGVAHAEGLADAASLASPQEGVAREKSALLAIAGTFAIACADDPWAQGALVVARDEAMSFGYGRADGSLYKLHSIAPLRHGTRVTIERPSDGVSANGERQRIEVTLPLLGEAAAENLVGALAAADCAMELLHHYSVETSILDTALARWVRAVPGRMAPRTRNDGALVIDDSYNANPTSYAAAIRTASDLAKSSGRRLLIVAGEMRELGRVAHEAHDEVGRLIAKSNASIVITCGGDAERIADAAARASITVRRAKTTQEAGDVAASLVQASDIVLVKGSRGVATEAVVDAILARGGEIADSAPRSGPPSSSRLVSSKPGRGGA